MIISRDSKCLSHFTPPSNIINGWTIPYIFLMANIFFSNTHIITELFVFTAVIKFGHISKDFIAVQRYKKELQ